MMVGQLIAADFVTVMKKGSLNLYLIDKETFTKEEDVEDYFYRTYIKYM